MYIMMCNKSIVNSIILQLHPQGIWLRCEFSHRVFWPTDAGDFILGSASDYAHLIVEGSPVSEAAASGASASLTTLSGIAHHLANGLVLNPLYTRQLHLQQKRSRERTHSRS